MAVARKETVNCNEVGVYHCISRCVRRAWLCGKDPYNGTDYSHRKKWIEDRLSLLGRMFAVDVCGYAVMTNHIHLVLRNRPDQARNYSNREIAERWLSIYSGKYIYDEYPPESDESKIATLLANKQYIDTLRKRLSSISWFMKTLNENIARKANAEDECTGRFWEGRFTCTRLLDSSAVLACMVYVDLNPVRAGIAAIPEQSAYTSIKLRCDARRTRQWLQRQTSSQHLQYADEASTLARCDQWLASVFRNRETTSGEEILPATFDQYLQLLDWTGRQLREGKQRAIPKDLQPIMQRMKINMDNWLETASTFGKRFCRVAGATERIKHAAAAAGRYFFKGIQAAREAFAPYPAPSSDLNYIGG